MQEIGDKKEYESSPEVETASQHQPDLDLQRTDEQIEAQGPTNA